MNILIVDDERQLTEALVAILKQHNYSVDSAYNGEDGLDLFRAMLKMCPQYLREDGCVLCEIGYRQGEDAVRVAAEHGFTCEILADLSGNPRVARMRRDI